MLFLQVKHFFMKKLILVFVLFVFGATMFTSCERHCICTYLDDGTRELISSAYSKKECMEYEDELNALGMNLDCDYTRTK